MSVLLKACLEIQCDSSTNFRIFFFVEMNKFISKFMWRCKVFRIAKNNFEEEQS